MMDRHDPAGAALATGRPRSVAKVILAIIALLLIVLFAGLGTWQVQRLQWKLALIERVESRVNAAPAPSPPAARWGQVSRDTDEYRHVRLAGHFLYEYTTPVQAVSELGAGFWLLTPLCTTEGTIVLVNRGFVSAPDARARYPARRAEGNPCAAAGPAHSLTGLLRITEPGGGFLRENDPANNRWFSRDVAAIAAARGLDQVAPFFVDARRGQDPAGAPEAPVGGLTVISFQNNHLVYAITWYALALMVIGAWWFVARSGPRGATRAKDNGSKA
ncbi:SURF1 family protein [Massilia sp. GCM10023247]|uniref:SURF1 family protein n=1 Tax=Massilia sp. GCM10023247 TaxID=3252643 RepID=UPI00362201C9